MTLDAHVVVPRDAMTVDVRLRQSAGVLAIVGPNGSGKSTTMRCLAGLLRHEGRVEVGGRVYDDAERGIHLAPHQRSVSVVQQESLLFPHLSVLENVAFGPRSRRVSRDRARSDAQDWLRRLSVGELAARRPGTLSGGQAQRVALARGLVGDPDLLLLDEPFSALDVTTRWEVRRDVRDHLSARTGVTVLVTHDPVDALTLATTVVVLEEGTVVQAGSPLELTRTPRTPYVARLVGLNLVRGRAEGTDVITESGARLHTAVTASGRVIVTFSPSTVALHRNQPEGSPRNVWPMTVTSLDMLGEVVRVGLEGPVTLSSDVTMTAAAELALEPGRRVWVSVKATELEVAAD